MFESLLVEKELHSQHHKTALSPFFPQLGLETVVRTELQPAKEKVFPRSQIFYLKQTLRVCNFSIHVLELVLPSALLLCSQRLANHGPALRMSTLLY
jgi:hypothetical protein